MLEQTSYGVKLNHMIRTIGQEYPHSCVLISAHRFLFTIINYFCFQLVAIHFGTGAMKIEQPINFIYLTSCNFLPEGDLTNFLAVVSTNSDSDLLCVANNEWRFIVPASAHV